MKKHTLTMLCYLFLGSLSYGQSSLVGPGSSYSSPFSTSGLVTHDVPGGGLFSLTLSNGVTTGSVGLWDLEAQGGANATILGLGLLESGAETELTGASLRFGVNNDNNSLLGLLGTGASIHYGWEATGYFDTAGSELTYSPGTIYHVSFDVDGNNGLLSSIAGLTPSFTFEFIDGLGNPLSSTSSGTLINVAGLLGTGVPTGTVQLNYVIDSTAPTGPIGVRFRGDAIVGASAVGIGTDFATVSNLTITASPVPEPGGGMLIASLGTWCLLRRCRRLASA